MTDRIIARLQFDFRGRSYDLAAPVDLAKWLASGGEFDAVAWLARAHGIDPYSYEYEIMQQAELRFESAEGSAAGFLHDGCFDAEGWAAAQRSGQHSDERLVRLAEPLLCTLTPQQQDSLLALLRQVYLLGQQECGG